MSLQLKLSRDAQSGAVILTGWEEPTLPQLILRERLQGRFLTSRGWQARSGFVPLAPAPGFPGCLTLEVADGSLPAGTQVQLEIPAISHRQEATWPAEQPAPTAETGPSPPPRAPRPGPQIRPEERRPLGGTQTAGIRVFVLGLTTAVAFAIGGTMGWFITWTFDQEVIQQLETARDTRNTSLESERAEINRQRIGLDTARGQLNTERKQLENDQQTLRAARSQLEADKVQLAAEQDRFKLERQTQTPVGGPPAAQTWLPAPGAGPGAPAAAPPPSPSVQEAALQCDLLAANPFDRNRSPDTPGVTMPMLRANAAAAIAACKQASEALPMQLRFTYQHARALQNTDPDQAFQLFAALARQRYPAAFDNMAWIILSRGGDRNQAAQLLREGAAMGDPDASFTLGMLIKDGAVPARPGENPQALLQRAAQQGHQGAQAVLNNMPPPVLPFPWLFGRR